MGINKAEIGVQNDLPNRIGKLERDLNDMKTYPQKLGNGSLSWAIFDNGSGTGFSLGPTALAAGATQSFTIQFMTFGSAFTYNGLPAINRQTIENTFVTMYVDTHTSAFASPYGASLTSAQLKVFMWPPYLDFYSSGLSDSNGQFTVIIRITNNDTSSHNVYVDGTALIPRPALKPQ